MPRLIARKSPPHPRPARRDQEPCDWYQHYQGLRDLLAANLKKEDSILMAGCGTSRMTEEMHEDG